MQIHGENYLVPIDCEFKDEQQTSIACFNLDDLFRGLSNYKEDKIKIVILDSCRTNPFLNMLRGSSMQNGFAQISNPAIGTIISFATSPDSPADDGEKKNGLFTGVLKDHILTPNLKIEELFKIVRKQVRELSNKKQTPWEHSCLIGDFYFLNNPVIPDKTVNELNPLKPANKELDSSKPANKELDSSKPVNIELNSLKYANRVGRNSPCPCGSGKKYKNCCGSVDYSSY